MYCRDCGEKIEDDASYCMYCGSATKEEVEIVKKNPEHDEPKVFMGVLMAMVLDVWGLLLGLLMYPNGSFARKSFIKYWVVTIVVKIVVEIVISVIIYVTYGVVNLEAFFF